MTNRTRERRADDAPPPRDGGEASPAAPPRDERAWLDACRVEELRRAVARFTRDEAAAEDILQDAALRLVLELRAGAAPDNPAAWLRRVATNLAVGRGRRLRVAARWLEAWQGDGPPPSPEAVADARERAGAVREALAALPERDRSMLLRAAEGATAEELAGPGSALAARSALCRARARLRAALEAR